MPKILAITGGVGGAKLALGLAKVLSPDEVMFAVNVGDDFEHLGLHISPDIDSLTYALAEENNQELGWGRVGETWQFIQTLGSLGGEDWFRLGDKDLALHMRRRSLLDQGMTLSEVTNEICQRMHIAHRVAPISNEPIRTVVHCDAGNLPFQHYFVKAQCQPRVTGFSFSGIEQATLNPVITSWLEDCDGIIICPSNPFVSVAPVLEVPGMLEAISGIPTIAVSPIVNGIAIKGPAAKMMSELQMPASATAVAEHYGELLQGFVLDEEDKDKVDQIGVPAIAVDSVMVTLEDRVALAHDCISFLGSIAGRASRSGQH